MATNEEIVAKAQQLYVSYYGRPADPEGLAFWTGNFTNSDNVDQALNAFGASAEYDAIVGGLTNEAIVTTLFRNMFNRDADADGLAFYTARLDADPAALAAIALDIANGAQNDDITTLANKVDVANRFTADIEANNSVYQGSDIPGAQAVLAGVGASAASVAAGEAAATAFVAALPALLPGGEYTLDEDSEVGDFSAATGPVTVILDGDSDDANFVVTLSAFDDTVVLEEYASAAISGGGGTDTLDTSEHNGEATVNLLTGSFKMTEGNEVFKGTISGVENVIGTDNADVITGSNADNSIWSGDGDDILRGGLGDDTFFFEDEDQLGDGTIDGQTDDDTIVFSADAVDLSGIAKGAVRSVENLVLSNSDGEDEVTLLLEAQTDDNTNLNLDLDEFESITGSDAVDTIVIAGDIDVSGADLNSIEALVATTAGATFTISSAGAPALILDAAGETDAILALASKTSASFDVAGQSMRGVAHVDGGSDAGVYQTITLNQDLLDTLIANNGGKVDGADNVDDGVFRGLDDSMPTGANAGSDVINLISNVDFTTVDDETRLGFATVRMGTGVSTVVIDNLGTVGFRSLIGGAGSDDTLVMVEAYTSVAGTKEIMNLTGRSVSGVENIIIDVPSENVGDWTVQIAETSLAGVELITGEVNFLIDVSAAGEGKKQVVDLKGVEIAQAQDLSSVAVADRVALSQEGLDGFKTLGAGRNIVSLAVDGSLDLSAAKIDIPAGAGEGTVLDVLGGDGNDVVVGEDSTDFLAADGRYLSSVSVVVVEGQGQAVFGASAVYNLGKGDDSFSGAATSLDMGSGNNIVRGVVLGDLVLTDRLAPDKTLDGNNVVQGLVKGFTKGGAGSDTLIGIFETADLGAGDDTVFGILNDKFSVLSTDDAPIIHSLGAGDDSFTSFSPTLAYAFANARDVTAASVVDGGAGDDTFVVSVPGDTLTGGAGNDVFTVSGKAFDSVVYVGEGKAATNLAGTAPTMAIGTGGVDNAKVEKGGVNIVDFNDGVPDSLMIDLVGTYNTGTAMTDGGQGLTGAIEVSTALAGARTDNGGLRMINYNGDLVTIAEGEAIGSTVELRAHTDAVEFLSWLKGTTIAGTAGGVQAAFANTTYVAFAIKDGAKTAANAGKMVAYLVTAADNGTGTVNAAEIAEIAMIDFGAGNVPSGSEIILI